MRDGLDPLGPQSLVQLWVDANILRSHGLVGKLVDAFDCPRSALLERTAVHAFVEMYGVFPRNDVLQGRAAFWSR
jgi:hypothetical protein